ncbi:MAG TPA: diguanylate cyclase [Pirellulales bacterium]
MPSPIAQSPPSPKGSPVDSQLNRIDSLLEKVDSKAASANSASDVQLAAQNQDPETCENRLAQVRLGMASSLFIALQCRDPATAAHSLRVALGCSAWGLALDLPKEQLDAIEVAALLHDVGKIGVPDCVLLKPAELTEEERAVMNRQLVMGVEILKTCCDSPAVLEIVRYSLTWFDGSRNSLDRRGAELPLGSRMLSIVNAFDAMINAQVYRPALSRDQAVAELCEYASTQFDPKLAFSFAQLQTTDQQKLHHSVARRWLQDLSAESANGLWQNQGGATPHARPRLDWLYQQKLLDNMYDGVIFLDTNLQVVLWNRGAERLTGISTSSILHRPFIPSLVTMRDEHSETIPDEKCPVAHSLHTGVQSLRRLIVRGRNNQPMAVDAHMIPVVGSDGLMQGVSLLLHDASGEASLEERCHRLYEQAIRDPLTQLANRAEFDRTHTLFVEAHLERSLPCSLIICDIDHFKQVNDTYGHQAGDEAIRCIARLLKNSCRPGDLVARYGGEEFVVLCADCSNETAALRAEQLRKAFSEFPQPSIGGKSCTASFGVTEIQPGDRAETMLSRADRALLMAKQSGRNRIIQLGGGMVEEPLEARRSWWFWQRDPVGPLVNKSLVTTLPLDITIQKLRGFISDHHAQVVNSNPTHIELLLPPAKQRSIRRRSDRPIPLTMEVTFTQEAHSPATETANDDPALPRKPSQTRLQVIARPARGRDRRRSAALEQARQVIASLRSYLMANEATAESADASVPIAAMPIAVQLN